MPSWST
ncbi:hypothetical protein D031_2284A, partial [Vibrio parahaemolyticus VP-48]